MPVYNKHNPNPLVILIRRNTVCEQYIRGEPQWKIAQTLGVTPQVIANDLKAVRKEWLDRLCEGMDSLKSKELARIDAAEHEFWQAWTASKSIVPAPEQPRKKKGKRAQEDMQLRDGNPRYLDGVLNCVKMRCQILGILGREEGGAYTAVTVISGVDLGAIVGDAPRQQVTIEHPPVTFFVPESIKPVDATVCGGSPETTFSGSPPGEPDVGAPVETVEQQPLGEPSAKPADGQSTVCLDASLPCPGTEVSNPPAVPVAPTSTDTDASGDSTHTVQAVAPEPADANSVGQPAELVAPPSTAGAGAPVHSRAERRRQRARTYLPHAELRRQFREQLAASRHQASDTDAAAPVAPPNHPPTIDATVPDAPPRLSE